MKNPESASRRQKTIQVSSAKQLKAGATALRSGTHIQLVSACSRKGMLRIVIPGKFPGLNDFIDANRRMRGTWNAGNSMKQADQRTITAYIPRGLKIKKKIYIEYCFFEPNSRRDKDNISGYFHKIFQDALVQCGAIKNDGWREIAGWSDSFEVDKGNPRIEVVIRECK